MGPHQQKDEVIKQIEPHWSFRDEVAVLYGVMMKGKGIIIVASPQKRQLEQLYINYVGTEKTRLLVCKISILD